MKHSELISEWKQNSNVIPVGVDDWIEKYGGLLSAEDIFIQSDDDVFDLLTENDMGTTEAGTLLTVAWYAGKVSPDYTGLPNPKQAIPIGTGQTVGLIMKRHVKTLVLESGEKVEYPTHMAQPGRKPKGPEDTEKGQANNETQRSDAKHYADVLSEQGIRNVKAYLAKTVLSAIRNRLLQLKAAKQDYKGEAKKLKKAIDKIVRELE